jgi:adenylate cyclase 1
MSQSEWSDEEDSEEEEPGDDEQESTGYITDDPALDNISVTNENGLTDAEGKSLFIQSRE